MATCKHWVENYPVAHSLRAHCCRPASFDASRIYLQELLGVYNVNSRFCGPFCLHYVQSMPTLYACPLGL